MTAPATISGSPSGEPSTTTRPMPQQMCEKLWTLPHLVSSLNQLSAISDIIMLARIDLTYRGVFYISWYAEKLAE